MNTNRGGAGALARPKKKDLTQTWIGPLARRDPFFQKVIVVPRCAVDHRTVGDSYCFELSSLTAPALLLYQSTIGLSGLGKLPVHKPIPVLAELAGISEQSARDAIEELLKAGFFLDEITVEFDENLDKYTFECAYGCKSHGKSSVHVMREGRAFRVKLHPDHATNNCVCWKGKEDGEVGYSHSVPVWLFALRGVPLLMAELALVMSGLDHKGRRMDMGKRGLAGYLGGRVSERRIGQLLAELVDLGLVQRTKRTRKPSVFGLTLAQFAPHQISSIDPSDSQPDKHFQHKPAGLPASSRRIASITPQDFQPRETNELETLVNKEAEASPMATPPEATSILGGWSPSAEARDLCDFYFIDEQIDEMVADLARQVSAAGVLPSRKRLDTCFVQLVGLVITEAKHRDEGYCEREDEYDRDALGRRISKTMTISDLGTFLNSELTAEGFLDLLIDFGVRNWEMSKNYGASFELPPGVRPGPCLQDKLNEARLRYAPDMGRLVMERGLVLDHSAQVSAG